MPQVIACDASASAAFPYLILTFVEGQPSEDSAVARQAGSWFRHVHDLSLPGWGPFVVDPDGNAAAGQFASLSEAALAELSGLSELTSAGLLARRTAAAVHRLVEVDAVLSPTRPGVLLHNDLKPAPLFTLRDADSALLTAVIDWGDARVGDPIADLARQREHLALSWSNPSARQAPDS